MAGPGYRSDAMFDLYHMQPYSLSDLLLPLQRCSPEVALYLPRTSDLRQLAGHAKEGTKLTIMHYCMEGASKVSLIPWVFRLFELISVGCVRIFRWVSIRKFAALKWASPANCTIQCYRVPAQHSYIYELKNIVSLFSRSRVLGVDNTRRFTCKVKVGFGVT